MSDEPRRVLPPAAASTARAAAAPRPRQNPARDFPPLVMTVLGFPIGVVGLFLVFQSDASLALIGAIVLAFSQLLVLIGTIAQGVYLGMAKAKDRGWA